MSFLLSGVGVPCSSQQALGQLFWPRIPWPPFRQVFARNLDSPFPLKHGSVRPQTLGKRISDDPQHFLFRRRKRWKQTTIFLQNFEKCETLSGCLPPRMAPFGLKLWENAFQMIPNISFFDAEKKVSTKTNLQKFSSEIFFVLTRGHICPGWRTYLSWLEDVSVLAGGHVCPS